MDFSELKDINLANIGASPLWVKVLMIGIACLAILFAGYY